MKIIRLLSVLSAIILIVSGLTACAAKTDNGGLPVNDTSLGKEMYDAEVKIYEFLEEKMPDVNPFYASDKEKKNIRFFPEGKNLICETKLEVGDQNIEFLRKALASQMPEPSDTAVAVAEELRAYLEDPSATYISRIVTKDGDVIYEVAVPAADDQPAGE